MSLEIKKTRTFSMYVNVSICKEGGVMSVRV